MNRPAATSSILSVRDLTIGFPHGDQPTDVVSSASLNINAGEIHGLVGESGSGKTILARAVLGLMPPGAEAKSGSIDFQGEDLLALPPDRLRGLRGKSIGMVFQEPMMSLNPAIKIGRQMAEAMQLHTDFSNAEIRQKSVDMLQRVGLRDPEWCLRSYPHEFSGGMRQRIMLASVLMMRPSLLIADEPTTALDVLIQREVLEIMTEIVAEIGTAVLLITHDLSVVAKYAHQVSVMHHGRIVEQGSLNDTLMFPRDAYTRKLLAALPRRPDSEPIATANNQDPIIQVKNLYVTFGKKSKLPWAKSSIVRAVDGVSFDIRPNETLAIVGESGSGKTTLGRAMLKLIQKTSGQVIVNGTDFDTVDKKAERALRRRMQIVFQDPYSSLDPRKRISSIVGEGLRLVPGMSRRQRDLRVNEVLDAVGIDPAWSSRYPHELSGGQRQRIGIARAVIMDPMLVVADEAVSALDLTVQAQVLELLKDLQTKMGFSYLFISHDLGVVEQIADRVAVMLRGKVVEMGSRDDIFDRPHHPYTCALLNAVPELTINSDGGYRLADRKVVTPDPPSGYVENVDFRNANTTDQAKKLVEISGGHFVAYPTEH